MNNSQEETAILFHETHEEMIFDKTSKYTTTSSILHPEITGVLFPIKEFHIFCEVETPFHSFKEVQKFVQQIPESAPYSNAAHLLSHFHNKKWGSYMFISDSLLWLVHMFIFFKKNSWSKIIQSTLPKTVSIILEEDFTKEAENQYIDVSYIERKYGFSKSVTKYHLWSYAKIFHFSNIRSIPLNELNKLHTWLDEQRYKWFALRKFILANFPQSVGENPIMFSNFIAYLHRQPLPHNCINVQGEFRHGIENTTLCSPFFIWCSEKELFKHVWLHLSEYKKTFKSL